MKFYVSLSFLASLLLVRLPPFYIFPIIKSSLLTSHSLARVIVMGLFALIIWNKEYLTIKSEQRKLLLLYLGYLFFHSLSAINAINFDAFLLRYKDVVFPGLFLLASFIYLKSKIGVVRVLILSLILNFIYQAIAFAWPSLYSLIGNTLLYEGHREFVAFNLSRGRIFIETYDEIVLPFLFMSGLYHGSRGKLYRSILPFLVIVPTMLSNFRSRLMMLVVSFGLTFVAWIRSWKTAVIMGAIAVVLVVTVDTLSLRLWGFSLVDRVMLKSNYDDVQSLTSRWDGINTSFEMGLSHPVGGVGIGNYFDFLPSTTRSSVFNLVNYYGGVWISSLNPHNIFAQIMAETGVTGLLYYLVMLGIFIKHDWKIFKQPRKSEFTTACVIAFWSLFSYSVFNPSTTLTYNTLFWVLRSMVIYESAD